MRTILTTVGTSLLSNARRDLSLPHNELPSEQQVAHYLKLTPPEKASAETNSLSRLLSEGDGIIFLHSQTEEGQFCATALKRHYESSGYHASHVEVPYLVYAESRFKMLGLRSLVAKLIELIREVRKQGREPQINATGGFKAEIAYATLVGLLFDLPVFYIHEAFRDIIEMPPTPIGWDYSLLAEQEDFLEWVYEEERLTSEVEERLRHRPSELRLLLTEVDNKTILAPTGEAFWEAYLDRLRESQSVPVYLSARAKSSYNSAEATIRALFDRTIAKLRVRDLRINGSDRVGNCDCLVFPKGHRTERLFYYETEAGEIRVCELARHSDQSYERLIEKGVQRSDYDDFTIWMEG
jgi:putative CRISPR-associated protein (TIGR02619 family)